MKQIELESETLYVSPLQNNSETVLHAAATDDPDEVYAPENMSLRDIDLPHPSPSKQSTPNNPSSEDTLPDYAGKLKNKKAKDKTAGSKAAKTQTIIPVRTPDRQWFFRAHRDPDMTLPIDILEIKGGNDEGIYFLDPDVEFPDELEQYIVPALITRCITSDGAEFFYLAKQSSKSPKESTRRCIREAKHRWIKQNWNATIKGYEFTPASQLRREPTWSDTPLNELLDKAFGDHYITSPDHEVIVKLIDPQDDDLADSEAAGA